MNSVVVNQLIKIYGDTVAVDGISFEVHSGEIFGMVGPNGAGKTTTIECIEGLRKPDSGDIQVLGVTPSSRDQNLYQRIGVQLQESALHPRLKVWEALDLFASFYSKSIDWEELLVHFGLEEKRSALFSKLSGGQKQRLFIALALLNDPELIFLDELTTGLDPQARHLMWDLVRDIRSRGKTVFLTTHYMEEAEFLCDRVAILDNGKIIALDTPENLIRGLGVEKRIVFKIDGDYETEQILSVRGVSRVEQSGERVTVFGHGDRLVSSVVAVLETHEIGFRDLRTEQANLEDVFLALTGREIRC